MKYDFSRQYGTAQPPGRGFRLLEWNDAPLDSLSRSTLIHGRASDALDLIPDGSVRTVVTSPPYWSLRDYEVDRQIGRDDSPR